jgi:hypothetical protein
VQKLGNTPEEYEDAYAYCLADRHFAIADGATESSFADRWARALTQQFVLAPPERMPPPHDALADWLRPMQRGWHEGINWDGLPWFAEEKARQGAFAALLGLKFERSDAERRGTLFFARSLFGKASRRRQRWEGFAVGDSCLFQVRDGGLIQSFPVQRSADFDSRPCLLASNAASNEAALSAVQHASGEFEPEDLFVLATDALAKWFLAEHESGEKPWERLMELQSSSDFEGLIAGLRGSGGLKNDDTTLVLVRWTSRTPRTPPTRELVATGPIETT